MAETGNIPPGNAPGETKWQQRVAKAAKPEIRLTAGKAVSVSISDLVDAVVKGNKVGGWLAEWVDGLLGGWVDGWVGTAASVAL